jgi:excisionase family DNA binding protein
MATPIQLVISKRDEKRATDDSPNAAQGTQPNTASLTCILVFAKDSEPFLAVLRQLADDSANPQHVGATVIRKTEGTSDQNDPWLHHNAAAEYLGISKSTLYRYAEHGEIESKKLGNRLEYRRSALDQFKNQKIRPARRSSHSRGIIAPAPVSGN